MKQLSFSRLWNGYFSDKAAMQARNNVAKQFRAEGKRVFCWTLPNQVKKYDGLGEPNGASCSVYMINVYE